ncbi:MAG: four helix bundle protein [Bacteroidota bacterium]
MKDIQDRTYKFALRIIKLSRALPKTLDGRIVGGQVLRSGTSVGANVEEAEAATTKKDFVYRIMVALREARETHYWLRLIRDSEMITAKKMLDIIDEANQIKKILGSIASKARRTAKR